MNSVNEMYMNRTKDLVVDIEYFCDLFIWQA